MRLPYVPDPPQPTTPDESAIVSRLTARSSPGPLQALDLTLLHAPSIADGWGAFLGAVRNKSSLPADLREIAVLVVAALLRSKYEINEHTLFARRAGVSEEGLREIREGKRSGGGNRNGLGLTDYQWGVVRYAEAMTRDVVVDEEAFERVKEFLSDKQVVELTATVAAINCAARFLVALDVREWGV